MYLKEKKLLIIVDMQYDFINGSLSTNGAEEIAKRMCSFLREKSNEYDNIVFTKDSHPFNHTSFKSVGGIFPSHCVSHTRGEAIYDDIIINLFSLYKNYNNITFLSKGTNKNIEEYSILKNPQAKEFLDELISNEKFSEIHVCGLLGNYCVGDTLIDLQEYSNISKIVAIDNLILSNDNGQRLEEIINTYKITKINI